MLVARKTWICAPRVFQAENESKNTQKKNTFSEKTRFLSPPRRPEDSRLNFERQNHDLRATSIPSGKKTWICAPRVFQAENESKNTHKKNSFSEKTRFLSPPTRPEDSRLNFECQNHDLRTTSIPSGKNQGSACHEYSVDVFTVHW